MKNRRQLLAGAASVTVAPAQQPRDAVLYSKRLRDAGYRLGHAGKWHVSWLRGPFESGFQEVAGLPSYRDAAKDNERSEVNVQRSKKNQLRRVVSEPCSWCAAAPFSSQVKHHYIKRKETERLMYCYTFLKGMDSW